VNTSVLIDIGQLRVGMYIQLDMGWMNHPFPVSSFRVASDEQIATLRALGLERVRYVPSKSSVAMDVAIAADGDNKPTQANRPAPIKQAADTEGLQAMQRRLALEIQGQALKACDQHFLDASACYREIQGQMEAHPQHARMLVEALVQGCVDDVLDSKESIIRLLSEEVGVRSAAHPVNVMVLSLLLGKVLKQPCSVLLELGVAAFLHDLGKGGLPLALMQPTINHTERQVRRYQSHVGESVASVERMGFPVAVLTAIAQHHERADGTGFPLGLLKEDMSQAGQILSLVNHYDRLCNPALGDEVLTPHEALSIMFAQQKTWFDPVVLGAFIRMMGVYPPGSVVQLGNDGYAIVVSVNSERPLRPCVVVYDPDVPKSDALIVDLEATPEISIRRSLRPSQLPRDVLDYLSPRLRVCYFFERAVGILSSGGGEA
jgi:HD-GYP domain-containing protein (c-di-GMP phosphodiesterase class II)